MFFDMHTALQLQSSGLATNSHAMAVTPKIAAYHQSFPVKCLPTQPMAVPVATQASNSPRRALRLTGVEIGAALVGNSFMLNKFTANQRLAA